MSSRIKLSDIQYGLLPRTKPLGKRFYVLKSSSALYADLANVLKNDSDGEVRIFTTVDAAVNVCTASRGDEIVVLPGHTETIDAAGDIALDVAGITVTCLGEGANVPVFTFDGSDATPSITVGAANITWVGGKFVCDEASLAHMFDIGAADDFTIKDAFFTEGSATGLTFITADGSDGDCDRLKILNCRFYNPTAGNGDAAIKIENDMVGIRIEDCDIYGDWDEGGISIPAGGNACLDLAIRRCRVVNLLTNVAAITINGTSCTGEIVDCRLGTDTLATALDNGSLRTYNVRWASTTDQVSSTPVFPDVDSASNMIGSDDADNAFASTAVVSDRDGSVFERLEAIMASLADDVATNALGVDDANNVFASTNVLANADGSILERIEYLQANATAQTPATFVPGLGFRVTKTEDVNTVTSDDLFTVTGKVLITVWTGEVTNALGAAVTDYKLALTTLNADLCAAGNLASAAIGFMFSLNGDAGDTSLSMGSYAVSVTGSADTNGKGLANRIVGKAGGTETIKSVRTAGDASDAIVHTVFYLPLEAGASMAAAA